MINWNKIPNDFIFEIDLGDNILKLNKSGFMSFMNDEKFSISSNGVIYDVKKQGIIPEILEKWFDERVSIRKTAKKYGTEIFKDGTINVEYSKEKYSYYDNLQKIQKILLNSIYGVLGLPSFRYYDLDNASATTETGVDLIKVSEYLINKYCTDTYGKYESYNPNENYVHYVDTDSCFVKLGKVINNSNLKTDEDKIKFILEIAKKLQDYISDKMPTVSNNIVMRKHNHFFMKQELVAKSGVWTTKKRYALLLVNKDGLNTDELEVKGLDVVRTSFPKLFRNFMKSMLKDILIFKTKEQIDSNILKLKTEVNSVDILDIARPTSIKEISKYCDNTHQPFNFTVKGTPVHVKAAINYNDFLRYYKLDDKFPYINDGEKIKWLYLRSDNPFRLDTLAFKDNDEEPNEILEYIRMYIDRTKVFESEMETKLQDFYNALGWGNIPTKVYQDHSIFF